MDLRRRYGTDPAMETDGVDIHLGDDAYITIARAGGANAAYQREMTRAFKVHKRAIAADTLSREEADGLMELVLARSVVLGWKNVTLDGAELPFTEANVLRVFKEIPEVYKIVMEESGRLANYRAEDIRDQGNGSALS